MGRRSDVAARTAAVLSYVLPLRRWEAGDVGELARYLHELRRGGDIEIIVVDGSDPAVFEHHHRQLHPEVRHLPVDPNLRGGSGKVLGVLTGLAAAGSERVVLADDDVRYEPAVLRQVGSLPVPEMQHPHGGDHFADNPNKGGTTNGTNTGHGFVP